MAVFGMLDIFRTNKIEGWIVDSNIQHETKVVLKYKNEVIAVTHANRSRPDLKEKKIHPTGICGFIFEDFSLLDSIELLDLRVEHLDTSTVLKLSKEAMSELIKLFVNNSNQRVNISGEARTCYLHVGMHKTGSSSIQKVLSQHTFATNTQYLKTCDINHSIPLYSLFVDNPEDYHINRSHNRDYYDCINFNMKNVEALDYELSKTIDDVIISGEDISVLALDNLKILKDFLKLYFDNVYVFIYIRAPHSYVSSSFQELVKNGLGNVNFTASFLRELFPNYKNVINKFDKVFGSSNVQVRLFDRNYLIGGDIVQDFVNAMGIDENVESQSANESLTLEEASILFVFNKYYISNRSMNSGIHHKLLRLRKLITPLAKNSFKISPELTQQLIVERLEDIECICNRLNIDSEIFLSESSSSFGKDVIKTSEQLETIAWQQIKILSENLEGKAWDEDRVDLLSKLVREYL